MRDLISLLERAATQPQFYMHVTGAENVESIMAHGLVPNHNGGNYDDNRWESLEGVYASKMADQLRNYLTAHRHEEFGLFIIEVDPAEVVPDEDIIDINLSRAFEIVINKFGVGADDVLERYSDNDNRLDINDPLWAAVAKLFMGWAGTPAGKPWTPEEIEWLIDAWFDLEYTGTASDVLLDWSERKDRFTRDYPAMINAHTNDQHSIRIPKVVGFEGPTKIVGVLVVGADTEVIYDRIPAEVRGTIRKMIGELSHLPEDDNSMRARLRALAIAKHPERSEEEIDAAIGKLQGHDLEQMLLAYEKN